MNNSIPAEQVQEWMRLAQQPTISHAIDAIHAHITQAVEARAPVCWSSGRCCHFESFGHRLYTTGIETAHTLLAFQNHESQSSSELLPILNNASQQESCPFLIANRCSIHTIRPAGCRLFFCDRSAEQWQQQLYEHAQEQIRQLHTNHDIPYMYADWRALLGAFAQQGIT